MVGSLGGMVKVMVTHLTGLPPSLARSTQESRDHSLILSSWQRSGKPDVRDQASDSH